MEIPVEVLPADAAGFGPLDVGVDLGDREAAFLVGRQFLGRLENLGIHEHPQAGAVALGRLLIDERDATRRRVRQWVEQQRVHDAEHGGVGTDAKRQRHAGDDAPALLASERPPPEPDILHECVDQLCARHATFPAAGDGNALGARRRQVAEPRGRGATGVGLGHAPLHVLARAHIDVERQLVIDVGLCARAPESQIAPPRGGALCVGSGRLLRIVHGRNQRVGAVSRTLKTAPATRAQ